MKKKKQMKIESVHCQIPFSLMTQISREDLCAVEKMGARLDSFVDLKLRSYDDEELRRSVKSVGRIITMCSSLKKVAIELRYMNRFASAVNSWLYFAIKHKVKGITLQFNKVKFGNISESVYELPQMLFSYSLLSKLSVTGCVLAPLGVIQWKSLESLTIDSVKLLDSVMETILSNCPLLRSLHLQDCFGLNYLNINSPNLTTLNYCDDTVCGDVPDISAPYLRILSIFSFVGGRQYKLTNVSSVVQATIGFYNSDFDVSNINTVNHIKQLLESLHAAEILKLGPHFLEIVSVLEVKSWRLPSFTKLWSLTLKVFSHEMCIPGILAILRSSPNLRSLRIKVDFRYDEEEMDLDQYEISVKDCNMDLVAYHLKTMEIKYLEAEHMRTLVQILLKSAKVLEKMVIHASSDHSMEIANKLLTFPRASPNAVVIIR